LFNITGYAKYDDQEKSESVVRKRNRHSLLCEEADSSHTSDETVLNQNQFLFALFMTLDETKKDRQNLQTKADIASRICQEGNAVYYLPFKVAADLLKSMAVRDKSEPTTSGGGKSYTLHPDFVERFKKTLQSAGSRRLCVESDSVDPLVETDIPRFQICAMFNHDTSLGGVASASLGSGNTMVLQGALNYTLNVVGTIFCIKFSDDQS
jgi:hypothetical protein